VESLVAVFVPVLILPFSILAALTPPETLTLLAFQKKLNQFLPLPLYLILCLLILLIQIFSVSITGLLYFLITIYLFWMKSFNFRDRYFRALLILIQVMTTLTIFLTFLTTCSFLDSPSALDTYQFIGINSLNDFSTSITSRGHFICEILLSLMTACLNRLFIYQGLNSAYQLLYAPNVDVTAMPLVEQGEGQGEAEEERMQGSPSRRSLREGSPTRRSLRERLMAHRTSDKVKPFKQ
jgi:hypothetical protein